MGHYWSGCWITSVVWSKAGVKVRTVLSPLIDEYLSDSSQVG
jgi:hypothetical protein